MLDVLLFFFFFGRASLKGQEWGRREGKKEGPGLSDSFR